MDSTLIRTYLPHRYPFLYIDKVIDVVPNESITALKNVTINEPFFQGHFPQRPVMPGVLLVEAMAQASGILTYKTLGVEPDFEKELFYLAGVDNCRFKRMVVPGDQLILKVSVLRHRRDLWKFKGEALVDGELACSAEFLNIRDEQ